MAEIGICGDDCGLCPRYVATKSGDMEKLKEVALLWKRVGWRDRISSPDDMMCTGCSTVTWCRYDDLRTCAKDNALDNCGECDSYPCRKILQVFEQTASYANACKDVFSKDDFDIFHRVFFSKKERLDSIHAAKSGKP
ncbi:MAG: DUF3795 domain-containing protein [Deltaproteobacteria bacterium]|nr:DUF3795 domain-containing protein [Deltaproteobacteria bacterium]